MTKEEEIKERKARYAKLSETIKDWPEQDRQEAERRGMTLEEYGEWFEEGMKEILNPKPYVDLEPILKKIIEGYLNKHYDENMDLNWHLVYDRELFKKPSSPTETIDKAVDWFYNTVLQYEKDKEA